MMWTCTACEFAANEDGQEANGGERRLGPEVVVIELPAKEKLGVKLMPPKDGVIDHGLAIDNINNPLLENKVQAGDLIVAIGGQNVDGMGFSDAIDLIRKMPRSLAISFEIDEVRRQEVVREKYQQNKDDDLDKELTTYAVVFDNGPMGLNLEEAVRYGIDGAVVRALKGQAKTSGMITVGDIVYKVNETDVLCMPYLEVMNVLRNATAPKTLQFVPKDKLADVQRVNSRHSESFRLRESTSHVKQKLMNNPRLVKDDGNDGDDNQSIAQLILDNQAATIKKGRMYKQGRVMRNWKSRYFVLSVSKVEYFKSPSSTTSRGEMSFLNHRCTVRSLPGTGDVLCQSPNVTAEYLLEIRVDDRRMVMASKALRTQRTESLSMDGTFLERNAGGRLSQFNYEAFSTPVVHVGVLSATNLTKSGSSVNALCEVTVGAETFKTSVVKNQRSPVWKQDNSASFEAPSDEMVVEIRIFDEHLFRATELIATLSIPLKSLPNMQKTTKKYPLALGSRSAGAVLTLSLEYQRHDEQRDEMVKIKAEAQMAADEATHHAARAQEEAHMLLEQSRQKAEAAMAAAREEQREGKAAVEKAMAEAARAKEEAEKQLAEAKRAQEEAQKLIEANRRIQESDVQGPSIYAVYRKMIQDGQSNEDVKKKMQENSIDEMDIEAFFDGINSYDEKIVLCMQKWKSSSVRVPMIEARMPKQSTLPSFDRGARQNADLLIDEREVRRNRESFACGSFVRYTKGRGLVQMLSSSA
ncbi:PH domain-like [Phytophthora cactorum]|nr:PH domain-like [Phytophthora cactorum]